MIACITIPYFAASVEHRDGATADWSEGNPPGLVIGGQPWEPQPVYAFSREAARKGVRAGMSLRLAHVISPNANFMAANPPRYFSASGEITDILSDFTHLIEPEALWHPEFDPKRKNTASSIRLPARFNIDFEMLPEKEAVALARQIGKNVRQKTWMNPAIGLAQNKFVAQIAATLTRPNHARAISPTETPGFLNSRSIHFLPLDNETSRRLSLLGIRTLGQLTALPLTTLQAQIAAQNRTGYHFSLEHEFSTLYALAKEETQFPLTENNGKGNHLLNVRPLDQERIERLTFSFDSPVSNMETVKRVLRRMAEELAGRLQSQNSSCQTLHISMELEGSSNMLEINGKGTSRHPTANPEKIAKILSDLFRRVWSALEDKGTEDFRSLGVIALAVTARNITSTTTWQLSLFQPIKATTKAIEVVENLIAKHESKLFYKAEILRRGHPLPEQRFRFKEIIPG